ncbi:methylmalonyl-CoA mutase family protein [Flavisolibacter ginsenosidimutans]|uniref:Fused isobutyryl-CoA mutase n=1 Tax=Flavisolibacter ginsenosidimutans TaxID=661481 RepID=A0A5B8UMA4_9BACT|nr:methylmalonyl-CoA mutase family protein [Flavisolibacter ginsenosidimutans]QEC57492.1 methylmalonyl-CoA mutase family protein [Flavisolibacter ginsenosidimutans]
MNQQTQNKIRIVTAASLFDGHDAAINIMRRILQSKGAEIIHLGHNRSVHEIVECAIEEDVQGIAITSYQGGHVEFFKYMKDLLDENGCGHIKIFGGGGGTILPQEIKELHEYGITRIYSPDDGRKMGLEGMIEDVINQCDFNLNGNGEYKGPMSLGEVKDVRKVARLITNAENGVRSTDNSQQSTVKAPVLGITGTGGAGKSSVTDEIVRRYLNAFPDKTIAVISVDPSKKKTGGALLGDRIRMNSISSPRAYMRSLATRDSEVALSAHVQDALDVCKAAGFDFIILESAGVGQSDASILDYCDVSLYVMTPEYGAASQLEKINMLDYADVVAINKFDKAGALDALADVRKQYKRNHQLWTAKEEDLPIVGTIAAQFNDAGINELFEKLMTTVAKKTSVSFGSVELHAHISDTTTKSQIIPPKRVRYLSEISESNRAYDQWVNDQCAIASTLYKISGSLDALKDFPFAEGRQGYSKAVIEKLKEHYGEQLHPECKKLIDEWPSLQKKYSADFFEYIVRDKTIKQPLTTTSLSGTRIPKVVLPKYKDWGDILRWQLQENIPGEFPYTAGVFELKRQGEDPTRMFAGEGGPERTNKRFHYVSQGQPAKRLSTAFDSVTLYGEDPAQRPDIYGKVGNSGVSIATVDDAKKLYSGFDLCDPKTSVSMTINGPAPMLLAFFMNAAIDQQCEKKIKELGLTEEVEKILQEKYKHASKPLYYNPSSPERLPEGNNGLGLKLLGLSGDEVLPKDVYEQCKKEALQQVRGTVQADILKEDQAQNTCIFSTEFALKLMGDVQEYFIQNKVRNFYSVSISGYHIAEAGANPITQLAFTLANGFTYVEYYLSRGMNVDDFAPNLSFFFSNGMDAEYSVIGRVARRIWAKAMKHKYKAADRSQKLKYHIQTSGRSLHAQEIDFNDIRTTLQALYAIYDNCNSLHTNAYDEAITTPTEESVRRAMAIQLIINRELGSAKTENFIQGSFAIEELTDLVEEAVLKEFDRITERGGVLGAMERMYQRNKIQEESLHYEHLKHTGELPLVGVNTFLNKNGSPTVLPVEVIRSTKEEKEQQIENLQAFWKRNEDKSEEALKRLKNVAVSNGNLFEELMETVKVCSLGQITHALYEVGGQYRRSM